MKHPIQEGAAFPTIYRIPYLNTHTESVPPYGIVQIVGASEVIEEDTVYFVTKPNGAATAKYLINGPVEVPPNSEGFATDEYPTDIAYYSGDGTPLENSVWGPRANFWTLHEQGTGYLLLGGINTDLEIIRAAALPGGGKDRLVAADPTDQQPGTLIEKVRDVAVFNPVVHQLVQAEVNLDAGVHTVRFFTLPAAQGQSYLAGCGLDLINGNTFRVDTFDLVAPSGGLYALNGPGNCTTLAIDHDCGLKITEEPDRPPGFKLRLDMNSIAGRALVVAGGTGECPKLSVDTGLGINIEDNVSAPNGEVALFRDGYLQNQIQFYGHYPSEDDGGNFAHINIGCGLHISPFVPNTLAVNLAQIRGDNLFVDALGCKLHAMSYLNGCSIDITQHPQLPNVQFVNVDVESLKGPGLKTELRVDAPGCHRLAVDYGCNLKLIDDKLAVDVNSLVSGGLTYVEGSSSGCDSIEVNTGLGLWLDATTHEEATSEVALHTTAYNPLVPQVYGHQGNAGENFRHINIGCGLKYQNGEIMLDADAIAMRSNGTIVANGSCGLVAIGEGAEPPELYTEGCGIDISPSNVISVDNIGLAGCGIKPGIDCALDFDPQEVAGDGLESVGGSQGCQMQVNYGCGLEFVNDTPTKAVAVKLQNPSGLECTPAGLKVKTGCGVELSTDNCVKFKPADAAGDGLVVQSGNDTDCDGPCRLAVGEGCGINVTADAVSVDRADLIAPNMGLKAGPGTCNLAVDATTEVHRIQNCVISYEANNSIKVRINFEKFLVYGIPNGTGFTECTIEGTECPNP